MRRGWQCETCKGFDINMPWKCPNCGRETCENCFDFYAVCKECCAKIGEQKAKEIAIEKGHFYAEDLED